MAQAAAEARPPESEAMRITLAVTTSRQVSNFVTRPFVRVTCTKVASAVRRASSWLAKIRDKVASIEFGWKSSGRSLMAW
jgi:hypothetical protein